MPPTVTDDGLGWQGRYTNGSSTGSWKWIAIGEGATAEIHTQTALIAEITTPSNMDRILATCSYEAPYKSVWYNLFTNNGVTTIGVNEAGIFDSLTVAGSHMLMRGLFPATENIAPAETLEITMKLLQAA